MEPHDEFEFKPINEGLGFHKKAVSLKDEMEEAELVEKKVAKKIPGRKGPEAPATRSRPSDDIFKRDKDIFSSIKDPSIRFYDEVDRNTFDHLTREEKRSEIGSQSVNSIRQDARQSQISWRDQKIENRPESMATPSLREKAEALVGETKDRATAEESLSVDIAPQFGPIALDAFVVFGLTSIFAVPLLTITEVDPMMILAHAQSDLWTQISVLTLFLSVMNFYLITSRSFFRSTLGEWAFDLALGEKKQWKKSTYPIRVAWRSFLMTITGILILPLIGMIMRSDLLGYVSGVKLTSNEDA